MNQFTAKAVAETLISVINVEVTPFSEEQHSLLYHGDLTPLGQFPLYVSDAFMAILRLEAQRLNVEVDDKALILLLCLSGGTFGVAIMMLSAMVQTKFAGRVINCSDVVSIWDGKPCPIGLLDAWGRCSSWIYLINTRNEPPVYSDTSAEQVAARHRPYPHQEQAIAAMEKQLAGGHFNPVTMEVTKGAGK